MPWVELTSTRVKTPDSSRVSCQSPHCRLKEERARRRREEQEAEMKSLRTERREAERRWAAKVKVGSGDASRMRRMLVQIDYHLQQSCLVNEPWVT